MASGISFDETTLQTILVDDFDLMYNEIKLRNGLKLSECCRDRMIGEMSQQGTISFQLNIVTDTNAAVIMFQLKNKMI
jgi:hypothetical protein